MTLAGSRWNRPRLGPENGHRSRGCSLPTWGYLAGALGLALLAACGAGEDVSVGGTPIVDGVDIAPAKWMPDEAWKVDTIPRMEIGVLSGADAFQLFEISAAALQDDGSLILADARAGTLRMYRADGSFARQLGGRGDGPGEFTSPQQIVVGDEGQIAIWDDSAWRVTRYDPEGGLAGVQTFDVGDLSNEVDPPLYPASGYLLSTGDLVVRLLEKAPVKSKVRGDPYEVGATLRQPSGALWVARDGSSTRLVARFPDEEQVVLDAPWGPFPWLPPLARRTTIAGQPGSGRFCIGDQEEALVRCYGADGTESVARWQARPITVDPQDPDILAWRRDAEEALGQKLRQDDLGKVLDQMPLPTLRPPYSSLLLDVPGNLWVARGPKRGGGTPLEYLVFDTELELLGSVEVPPGRVLAIGEDYLIQVRVDEFDVQYVEVRGLWKPDQ